MNDKITESVDSLLERYGDPELRMKELFRNYNLSLELIKNVTNSQDLLDLILREYLDRFDELPGKDFVHPTEGTFSIADREKFRSLVMFATQAILLKENAEIFHALEQNNQELIQTTEELKRANEKLKKMNAQYLNMLGFVSHELRSPLISILGFAELLDENLLGSLNEEQSKAIKVIMRSTKGLIDMIQNYLDLAKIEQGELKIKPKTLELIHDVLLPTIEQMREQFVKRNMAVTVESSTEQMYVNADEELLKIVLVNILSNAVKYGEENGKVEVVVTDRDGFCRVSITNTGIGVPKEELLKIFGKFTRLDFQESQCSRGAGLGLYNTQCIIEQHGGKIWAESEYGKWFRVNFEIPLLLKDVQKIQSRDCLVETQNSSTP